MNDRDAQTIAAAQQLHEALRLVARCLDDYPSLPMDWFNQTDAFMAVTDLVWSIVERLAPRQDQRMMKDAIMDGDIIEFINTDHIRELGLNVDRFMELDADESAAVLQSLSFEWQAEQLLILAPNLQPEQLGTFASLKPRDRITLMAIVIDRIKPRYWADLIAYLLDNLQQQMER
jgi:hypothetical protein